MLDFDLKKNEVPQLTEDEIRQFRGWLTDRNKKKCLIVGISGASTPQFGTRLVEVLSTIPSIETHLIITEGAKEVMRHEMGYDSNSIDNLCKLANVVYDNKNMAASVSSGSFKTEGMIIAPCSMKTLADVALARDESLVSRAAIVCLKENRRVVLVPRETPATLSFLRNMVLAAENGAVILPPVPAFYHKPKTVGEIIDHTVQKILDQFNIEANLFSRWETPKNYNEK